MIHPGDCKCGGMHQDPGRLANSDVKTYQVVRPPPYTELQSSSVGTGSGGVVGAGGTGATGISIVGDGGAKMGLHVRMRCSTCSSDATTLVRVHFRDGEYGGGVLVSNTALRVQMQVF